MNLSEDDAEIWMVNFIRTMNIKAKIDSEVEKVKIEHRMPKFMEHVFLLFLFQDLLKNRSHHGQNHSPHQ